MKIYKFSVIAYKEILAKGETEYAAFAGVESVFRHGDVLSSTRGWIIDHVEVEFPKLRPQQVGTALRNGAEYLTTT